jgi:YcxB-like protein
VSSPSTPLPDKLVFTYQEDEATAYGRLVGLRRDRGPDYMNFEALMVALTFAIGFIVLIANYLGFVASSEMPHVLFTAYAAFIAGAFAHRAAMQVRRRAIARASFRDSEFGTETFETTFDCTGVAYDSVRCQMRVPWMAIAEVIEAPLVIVLLFDRTQGLPIPARVFTDAASRAAFVATVRELASNARRQS